MATRTRKPASTATATPADAVEKTVVEGTTTLDSDITKPSVTAPGDGPADTTDPTERASTVTPQPSQEALQVGTVNAVLPVAKADKPDAAPESDHRIETYPATKPDGTVVTVTHNIDTGETSISDAK